MSKGNINWSDHLLNFVSVIVGVSLAFVISNRSELSKQQSEFDQNIAAILEEVESDIETYETYQIPDNKAKLEQMNQAIQMISDQVGGDSINAKLFVFFDVNNYAPTNITINSLISSGRLDLMKDFKLKKNILFYQNLSLEMEAQGSFQVDFLTDRLMPWFIENGAYFMEGNNYIDGKDPEIASTLMMLSLYTSFVENKISKYEYALENAKALRDFLIEYKQEEGIQ